MLLPVNCPNADHFCQYILAQQLVTILGRSKSDKVYMWTQPNRCYQVYFKSKKKTDGCLHTDPAKKLDHSSRNFESESMGDCQLVTISEVINKLCSISCIVSRSNAML